MLKHALVLSALLGIGGLGCAIDSCAQDSVPQPLFLAQHMPQDHMPKNWPWTGFVTRLTSHLFCRKITSCFSIIFPIHLRPGPDISGDYRYPPI